jgi:hypothetical protein
MEQENRSNEAEFSVKRAVGFALLMIVIIGFVVPVGASGAFGNWVQFLRDFQTLIGGLAAIAAAYITIQQMHISDEKSDKRHSDILRLTLLSDKRRIERAVNPQRQELAYAYDDLCRSRAAWQNDAKGLADKANMGKLYRLAKEINEIISRPPIRNGSELFDGSTASWFYEVDNLTNRVVETVSEFINSDDAVVTFAFHKPQMERVARELEEALNFLVDGIDSVAEEHDVEVY